MHPVLRPMRLMRSLVLLSLSLLVGRAPLSALPPGFLPGWTAPAGTASQALALGDIDGDGDIDAYVADWYDDHRFLLNDGTGHFTLSTESIDAGYVSCARLARLDADATLDLWLTRHLESNQSWEGAGDGSFAVQSAALGGSLSRSGCALGDMDGDGDLDAFAATNSPSAASELFKNDGSGTFVSTGQAIGAYSTTSVALGDVDGDLDLDVLLGNNGADKLWKNNGTGTLTEVAGSVTSGQTFDVALADLDDDGDLDAFFANGGSSANGAESVRLNDGTGVFTANGQTFGEDYSFSLELFVADGDDDLDAFVGNNAGAPNRLYLNDGSALFTDSGEALGLGGTADAGAADLDGDTDLDLFLINIEQPAQVFLNDGSGEFTSNGELYGSNTASAVALGDIDGDGDRDAVMGSYRGIVRVFRNDGLGAFTDDDQWLSPGYGPSASSVALADFDADGDLDAWVGFCCTGAGFTDDPPDRLFVNDGAGNFTLSPQVFGNDYTMAVIAGDFDGDDDPDVIAAHYSTPTSTGANRLYRNDGTGTLSAGAQSIGSGNHSSVAAADLDGDDDLDLVFGKRLGGAVAWRNNGNAFFGAAVAIGTDDVISVALGDLDGDGDIDLWLGNATGDTVWLGNGAGAFSNTGQSLGSAWTLGVHLVDLDRDGDLDAWTTNSGGLGCDPHEVWLNDGAGEFTDAGWDVGCGYSGASALANLDRDNDEDLFFASSRGDHRVWINQIGGPIFDDGFESGDTTGWSATVP